MLAMTIPILVEQTLIQTMVLANAGMAARAGTATAGAVGLASSFANVLANLFSALALGGTVAVSRARGAADPAAARAAAADTLRLAAAVGAGVGLAVALLARPLVGLLYAAAVPELRRLAADYLFWAALGWPAFALALAASGVLRGAGDPRTAMAANVAMNLANVLFGRLLIFGLEFGGIIIVPAFGAAGAGAAISLARAFGVLLFLPALFGSGGALRLRRRDFRRTGRTARRTILNVAWPAAVEGLAFNGGKLLTQTYVAALGAVSVGADFVASAAAGLLQAPVSSLQTALTPLVGVELGARSPEGASKMIGLALKLSTAALVAVSVPGFVFADRLVGSASADPEVVALGAKLLRCYCVVAPVLWAGSFLVPSGLRGGGDGRFVMGVALGSMWAVRVGLGWLLALPAGLGILGVWIAMMSDWLVRLACFAWRLRSGRWLRRSGLADGTAPDGA
jgi:putative MATE family efflux protein